MQVSQGDISSNKVGAEDSINFRSSPNFKNMKKFLKNKLDLQQPSTEKCEAKKEVQPPLPLDPPPNDDIEATSTINTSGSADHGISKEENSVDADLKKAKETICRDFLRGTCTRIGCRYAHKSDVSHEDLYGVYTFCREYQSQVCARAHCRYVHATVFEEQEYYRTRYLPPHAFAHMLNKNPNNNNNNLLMPPPPPPPPKTQPHPKLNKESVNFNVPPPPLHNETAAVDCVASNAMKVVPSTIASLTSLAPPVQSATKRDWTVMESFSNPGRGLEAEMQPPKKCKQCNNIEFRYQYNKDKLEKLKQAKEEIHKKIAILDKNSEKLNTFIQALLIRSLSKSPNLHGFKDKLSDVVGAMATIRNDIQV
ncbi:uncharacterized protein LOC121738368 [Aricia agestis]|uniref:uncharacterized protein LOC121738368 n=1 Tax=Aricia agestis TaxID=91739 RepID=UPI001C209B25|nr:uncharacterized protein LOC121738368 [Aricia agestis]